MCHSLVSWEMNQSCEIYVCLKRDPYGVTMGVLKYDVNLEIVLSSQKENQNKSKSSGDGDAKLICARRLLGTEWGWERLVACSTW